MKKNLRDAILATSTLILALIAAWWQGWIPNALVHSPESTLSIPEESSPNASTAETSLRLPTVNPRRDQKLEVAVSQPAEVAPYYQVQLFAETAGTVVMIEKDVGDEINRDEIVAEIRPAGTEKPIVITSPLDGIIVSRSVDPGTFVPNAGLIPGAVPLVTIAKLDIVTVSMNVPDMYAPYVKQGMTARIRNPNAAKAPWIETKLTRVSPVVRTGDRTRQVQVDLFNETRADFDEMLAEASPNDFEEFKSRQSPEFPVNLSGEQRADLTPGLIHEMRLVIDELGTLPLLPSNSIVRKSGKPFVFLIENGKLEQVPVLVQFDDGQYTYVRPIRRDAQGHSSEQEWIGNEEIVLPNALDLRSGKSATGELQDW